MRLDPYDVELLVEALAHRASRLEAVAVRVKFGRNHDLKAADMRKLRARLIEVQPKIATIVANSC